MKNCIIFLIQIFSTNTKILLLYKKICSKIGTAATEWEHFALFLTDPQTLTCDVRVTQKQCLPTALQ